MSDLLDNRQRITQRAGAMAMRHKAVNFVLSVCAMLSVATANNVWADDTIAIDNPVDGEGWTVMNGVVTITADGTYNVTGTSAANRIVVGKDITATITLDNAHITSSVGSPLALSSDTISGSVVTLRLVGNNSLTARAADNAHYAGLAVEDKAQLVIEGSGSLTATGGAESAGIGGGPKVGTITIRSGTLTAIGGPGGAGIGAGQIANGQTNISGNISISGGDITATGGDGGAGIGGGQVADTSDTINGAISINISGGNIMATGSLYGSAGIGGGTGGSGGTIAISGGTIIAWTKATGEYGSPAALGGGAGGNAGTISISGGTVYAWAATNRGIGSGWLATEDGAIRISGGSVLANTIGDDKTATTISGATTLVLSPSINTSDFGSATVATGAKVSVTLLPNDNNADVTLYADLTLLPGVTLDIPNSLWLDGNGRTITVVTGASLTGEAQIRNATIVHVNTPPPDSTLTIDVAKPAAADYWTIANNIITITSNGNYVVTGTSQTNRLVVAPGIIATITFRNAHITSSSAAPFTLLSDDRTSAAILANSPDKIAALTVPPAGAHVTLTLEDNNELISTAATYAGLQVEGEAQLSIQGDGSLSVSGGAGAAGISLDKGNITFSDGIIIAKGGAMGAGIGSGTQHSFSGTLSFSGGTITATGGNNAAAIGGGSGASGGTLSFSGGTITATGGNNAAAIGGGYGASGGTLSFSGGTITATGGNNAAAIGGGYGASGGTLSFSGGTITAIAGASAAAIGGGYQGNAGTIRITGGVIYAYGASGTGVGIGQNGNVSANDFISITDGTIISNEIGDGQTPLTISGATTILLATVIRFAPQGSADISASSLTDSYGDATVITGESRIYVAIIPGDDKTDVTLNEDLTLRPGAHLAVPNNLWLECGGKTITVQSGATLSGEERIRYAIIVRQGGTEPIPLRTEWVQPIPDQPYTGNAICPTVIVRYGTHTLAQNDDYTVAYSNNVYVGTATADITGCGTYTGTVSCPFTITPASPQAGQVAINGAYAGNPPVGGAWTFSDHTATIIADGDYVITGKSDNICLVVAPDVTATLTLQNVHITSYEGSALALSTDATRGSDVTLRLSGDNELIVGKGKTFAALQVEGNARLTIEGGGSLTAKGGGGGDSISPGVTIEGGAGIGAGNNNKPGGIITIRSGNLTASGGTGAAGIGGGAGSASGTITILGGNVTAIGGDGGAGIGGGSWANDWNIAIAGGNVTATGGVRAAAIGGGEGQYQTGGSIIISGGVTIATNPERSILSPEYDDYAAAIGGGGESGIAGTVTITGGTVYASSSVGPGIGGGNGSINITGGAVVADEIGSDDNSRTLTPVNIYGEKAIVLANAINMQSASNASILTGNDILVDIQPNNDNHIDVTLHSTLTLNDSAELIVPKSIRFDFGNKLVTSNNSLKIEGGEYAVHDTLRSSATVYILRDTFVHIYHDTLRIVQYDTLDYNAYLFIQDTVYTAVYDTVYVEVPIGRDTLIVIRQVTDTIETILRVTDTITREVVVPRDNFVYIVLAGQTGVKQVLNWDSRVTSDGNNLRLEGLTPSQPFAIYTLTGALVVRAVAPASGTYILPDVPPDLYIFYHAGRYSKFVHRH